MATHLNELGSYFSERRPVSLRRAPACPRRVEARSVPGRKSPLHAQRAAASEQSPQGHEGAVAQLLPLVKRMALRMREHLPAHVEVDDLVGAGMLGLLDAVRKFDARKRVRLESYARYRIRGAILDGLRSSDIASRDMRKKNKRVEEVHRKLQGQFGRPVTDPEMAQALGVSLEKWYRTIQELQALGVNWLRPVGSAASPLPCEELLLAEKQEDPFDLCYRQEQREILHRALARLPEREQRLMVLYYGQELTMREIAARLAIDESRVSQLHSGALACLRRRVQALLRSPRAALPATPVAPAFLTA